MASYSKYASQLRNGSCVVDLNKLPNEQGCYAIFLKSGRCLKVGIAGDYYGRGLRGRVSRHFNGSVVGSIFAEDLASDKELGAKYNLSSRKGRAEFAKTKCCVRFSSAKGISYSELKKIEDYLVDKLKPKYFGYKNEGVNKADKKTNFPSSGDNEKISISNSKYPQFSHAYAKDLKENYPKLWRRAGTGGNPPTSFTGNDAFRNWTKYRQGDRSPSVLSWVKRRERFANRHYKNTGLNGAIAHVKWGTINASGVSGMKQVINEAKKKMKKVATSKSGSGKMYPLASRSRSWDSDGAIQRIRKFTNSTESPSESYKQAFMYCDYENQDNFSAYKLPYLDVIDGRLKAVPKAIFAIASVLRGGRGGVDIPEESRSRIERLVNRYYRKMSIQFDDEGIVSPFSKYYGWGKNKDKKRRRRMKKNFNGTVNEIKYLLSKAEGANSCKKPNVCVIVNEANSNQVQSDLDWDSLKFDAVIKNVDEDQRIVSGPVLVPEEVDKQGDVVSAVEIEKAAHDYMKNYQHINIMHNNNYNDMAKEIVPIESAVLKVDLDYYGTGEVLKKGTWILDVYVGNDKVWDLIKKGELTGYSIEGLAERVKENV
tara:strand:- start:1158 stop:2945 length:1788 start_codon:yes stop_codon:yes gene_type:complete